MTEVIVLPGASSAEGIAAGRGATFFAGDAFDGHIFRGDIQRGTAELFIEVPEGERTAVGMAADVAHDLLFVAGGFKGQGYIYNTRSGATVATYQFAAPSPRRPPYPPRRSTTWPHQRRRLVHRLAPAPAVLRPGQPGRSPRDNVPHPGP